MKKRQKMENVYDGAAGVVKCLKEESDRGVVIVSCSYIDYLLGELHKKHIEQFVADSKIIKSIFSGFGPLSDFSGKISLAYSYGLIDKSIFSNLEILRSIRNELSHEPFEFKANIDEYKSTITCLSAHEELRKLSKTDSQLMAYREAFGVFRFKIKDSDDPRGILILNILALILLIAKRIRTPKQDSVLNAATT